MTFCERALHYRCKYLMQTTALIFLSRPVCGPQALRSRGQWLLDLNHKLHSPHPKAKTFESKPFTTELKKMKPEVSPVTRLSSPRPEDLRFGSLPLVCRDFHSVSDFRLTDSLRSRVLWLVTKSGSPKAGCGQHEGCGYCCTNHRPSTLSSRQLWLLYQLP